MPKIVVLGAGIGGISMAYELRAKVRRKADILVVSDSEWFQFVPSNPWVALGWRKPEEIKVHLPEVLAKYGIGFDAAGAKRVLAGENALELNDGRRIAYDYLVIATGPAQNVSNAPADNAAITVAGTASVNHGLSMAYHKSAFAFATADMVMPRGVDFAAREVFDGVSMRIVRQYDINADKFPCRLDVLYGFKTLRPQLACRLANN